MWNGSFFLNVIVAKRDKEKKSTREIYKMRRIIYKTKNTNSTNNNNNSNKLMEEA